MGAGAWLQHEKNTKGEIVDKFETHTWHQNEYSTLFIFVFENCYIVTLLIKIDKTTKFFPEVSFDDVLFEEIE